MQSLDPEGKQIDEKRMQNEKKEWKWCTSNLTEKTNKGSTQLYLLFCLLLHYFRLSFRKSCEPSGLTDQSSFGDGQLSSQGFVTCLFFFCFFFQSSFLIFDQLSGLNKVHYYCLSEKVEFCFFSFVSIANSTPLNTSVSFSNNWKRGWPQPFFRRSLVVNCFWQAHH